MFQNKLKNSIKVLKYFQVTKESVVKCFSTAEKLIPVKLASAMYESTSKGAKEPPFVILHGLFGSKQNWSSLCKAYNQKMIPPRKIIALDLRNHGESEHSDAHSYYHLAEDVKQFLLDHNFDKIALMGHSMGGRCAMLFALQYPELVEKLIIVDISPITQSPHFGQMPSILNAMESVQFPVNTIMSRARTIVDKQLAENIASPDLRAFLLTNMVQIDNQRYKWRINIPVLLQNFDHIARFPIPDNMKYTGKTFFLGGEDSEFIPYHDNTKPKRLVYAVDLRNHGDSAHSKDNSYDDCVMDVLKFVQTMDLKKISLLGHDVGGRVAMLFSLKYPEFVEKLIVVDISPITTSHELQIIPDILRALNDLKFPMNMSLQQAKLHAANHLARLIKNRGQLMYVLMNLVQHADGRYSWRFNIKALMENFSDIASFPEIHNITYPGPTLFLGGAKSDFIQKSDFPKIQQLFPNVDLKYIEGAGHWVHSEKPHEFLKVTLDFLNQSPKSES